MCFRHFSWRLSHALLFVLVLSRYFTTLGMICEILRPIFDALDDEFGFHGLGFGGNWGSVKKTKGQISNAQNLRRIKQRKGNPQKQLKIIRLFTS